MFFDLHIHTNYSKCSRIKPNSLLKIAKKKNLDGIAVTDHNTIKGALKVASINKDKNFEVIIGNEIKTAEGGEILAFYLQENVKPGPAMEVIDKLKEQDCIISLSHPFDRLRANFKNLPDELISKIDALEVMNGRSLLSKFNKKARKFAKEKNLAFTGGSDAHFHFEIGKVRTECKDSLREAIKNKLTKVTGTTKNATAGYVGTAVLRDIMHLKVPILSRK